MNQNLVKAETFTDGTIHLLAECANVRDAFAAIESFTAYLNSIRERTQRPVELPVVPDTQASPMDTLGKVGDDPRIGKTMWEIGVDGLEPGMVFAQTETNRSRLIRSRGESPCMCGSCGSRRLLAVNVSEAEFAAGVAEGRWK